MRVQAMTIGLLLAAVLLGTVQAQRNPLVTGGSLPQCDPNAGQGINDNGVCANCPAGFFASAALPGPARCLPCFPGQFSKGPANSACTACPTGTFAARFGSTSCLTCPSGDPVIERTFFDKLTGLAPITGASLGANACKTGATSNGDGTVSGGTFVVPPPNGCPDGQGVIGSTCGQCQPGSASVARGTSVAPGSLFISEYFGILCFPCTPGTFSNGAGSTSCTPCAPGTIAPNFLTRTCLNCANGFTSVAPFTACSLPPTRKML